MPASIFESALLGMPRYLATSSCFNPTYSRALRSLPPSASRSGSTAGGANPARSSGMFVLLLGHLNPDGLCRLEQVLDARFGVLVAAARGEGGGQRHAEEFLDRADDLHDRQRIDLGFPTRTRRYDAGRRAAQDRLRVRLLLKRVTDARFNIGSGK